MDIWAGIKNIGAGIKNIPGRTTAAGVLGLGAVGLTTYLATRSGGREFKAADVAPLPELPPLLTPQDLMMQGAMPMGEMGPADGYHPNQWQRSVLQGRGQNPELAAPAQPRMSAISPDAVGDLGGATHSVA